MHASSHDHGLPCPERDVQFYEGVPARRLVAFLIDTVLVALIGAAAGVVLGVATLGLGFLLFFPIMAVSAFLYRFASVAKWSATPGMLAVGIELRNARGRRFDRAEAFLHSGFFTALAFTGVLLPVNAAVIAFSPLGRGLHDLPMGSTAINRPA